MSELMDFKARENFDFLKFAYPAMDVSKKENFRKGCEKVLECAHATVRDLCCLGLELGKLRDSNVWQKVINPKSGVAFMYSTFADFCEYAFEFSKTKTSDLLRIAQFVTEVDGKVEFLDDRYSQFKMSQLVELAPVDSFNRKYFKPEMTIQEMRLVKEYMTMGLFCLDRTKSDFDLMTYANAYAEDKKARNAKVDAHNAAVKAHYTAPAPVPTEEPIEEDQEEESAPISLEGKEEVFEEPQEERESEDKAKGSFTPEQERKIRQAILSISEVHRIRIYDFCRTNPDATSLAKYIQHECGLSGWNTGGVWVDCSGRGFGVGLENKFVLTWAQVAKRIKALIEEGVFVEVKGYDFSTRDGVRAFLNDYENWTELSPGIQTIITKALYQYVLKNGTLIYAMPVEICTGFDPITTTRNVDYFIRFDTSVKALLTSKGQLERYFSNQVKNGVDL